MSKIELWFPVAIYQETDTISKEENDLLKQHSQYIKQTAPSGHDHWQGNTYTTHASYNILEDTKFSHIVNEITKHVNSFAKQHTSGTYTDVYTCKHAWLNIAQEGNFQEYHSHNGSIFSAVYYVAAPEGSGKIVFEDPKEPDMLPLKKLDERNELSFIKISYPAMEGFLIIFRSYLRHMVEAGTNKEDRISIALNFS